MFLNTEALHAGLPQVAASPSDAGILELIVCRPGIGERRELDKAVLDVDEGLVGDNWRVRGYPKAPDGAAHPDMQLNIMNARAIALIAQQRSRWPLAGDQFYIDLDLSYDNLPPGTRLAFGTAIVEITAEPHLGCQKFSERFGRDAALFVNSEQGKALNMRGVNARIVQSGIVRAGQTIRKITI
jgi:hypothetical protein